MENKTKKTADLKAYQKEYRQKHPKDKTATNEYMKTYIKNAKDIPCELCGGHYKAYSAYKHVTTQKHLKAMIKGKEKEEEDQVVPQLPSEETTLEIIPDEKGDIPLDDVVTFINEHFVKSANPLRSAENKTPRVNKNLTTWKKVSQQLEGKTWKYVSEHIQEIVSKAYDKPSSQADAVSMLKLVLGHFTTMTEADMIKLNKMNRELKDAHIAKQVKMPENGVTYAEMKPYENAANTTLALLMRLYNGEIPALRIGDYLNAFVGKTETLNEIDIKKKVMIRRIVKNQKEEEMRIPLPASLVQFIKEREIKGALFGDETAQSIDKLLAKTFPQQKANPRYFRDLYSTEITPTLTKAKLKKVLAILDHAPLTHAAYYRKMKQDPLTELIAGK
tara:strand:- start:911 stop:2077 length:1167 start_codon:yes stop_codon:yes gene_type:complete